MSTSIELHFAREWISFPRDNETQLINKARFMDMIGFPRIIGAIDCTHIDGLAANEEKHNYVNRKGFHFKNVQLICNFDLQILNVQDILEVGMNLPEYNYYQAHTRGRNCIERCNGVLKTRFRYLMGGRKLSMSLRKRKQL